jgi:Ca-activated chloride channel family protein
VTFARPGLLWLAAFSPLVAAVFFWVWRRRIAALRAWSSSALWDRLLPQLRPSRAALAALAVGLTVAASALALARPRWGAVVATVERHGIDIVFVLDTSLSMAATDVAPSRLTLASSLVRRLAGELAGHRLGLVQTEGDSVALAPLTTDAAVLDLLLDGIEPASLPVAGSQLAQGLRRAVSLFPPGDKKHRAIVLLSDGEDHGGLDAALTEMLREEQVTVFAIGLGTAKGSPIALPAGAPGEFKRDRDGRVVITRLQSEVLADLARDSGGRYVEVAHARTDIAPVLTGLAAISTRRIGSNVTTTAEERFQWPLAIACFALFGVLLTSPMHRP